MRAGRDLVSIQDDFDSATEDGRAARKAFGRAVLLMKEESNMGFTNEMKNGRRKDNMLQIEEAQSLLNDTVKRISETEAVPLPEALGRELAGDLVAGMDQPPFPRSPLDGYAVRSEDIQGASKEHPVTLRVIGKIYAGYVYEGRVSSGEAVRLMTGAPIPDGADAVIRQEDTCESDGMVQIYASLRAFQNYCYQGEDYKAGTVLAKKGTLVNAGIITVASSLGLDRLAVTRQPRVSVISTGDEVLAPGETWSPGKIYDSNRAYVCARLGEGGIKPVISMHISDEADTVAAQIREAARYSDMIITTGGVSVGEKDIMHDVIDILGARRLFWKVRIKPGSPTLAFVYDGVPVVCLSGNPFGAIANFELLIRGMLAKMTGLQTWILPKTEAVLQNDYRKPAGARRFLRGFLEDGKVTVNGKNQASGAIAAMAECNCLIEISPDMPGAAAGEKVTVYCL